MSAKYWQRGETIDYTPTAVPYTHLTLPTN